MVGAVYLSRRRCCSSMFCAECQLSTRHSKAHCARCAATSVLSCRTDLKSSVAFIKSVFKELKMHSVCLLDCLFASASCVCINSLCECMRARMCLPHGHVRMSTRARVLCLYARAARALGRRGGEKRVVCGGGVVVVGWWWGGHSLRTDSPAMCSVARGLCLSAQYQS